MIDLNKIASTWSAWKLAGLVLGAAGVLVGGIWFVVDTSLRGVETAVFAQSGRMDGIDNRLNTMDRRFDVLQAQNSEILARLEGLDKGLNAQINNLTDKIDNISFTPGLNDTELDAKPIMQQVAQSGSDGSTGPGSTISKSVVKTTQQLPKLVGSDAKKLSHNMGGGAPMASDPQKSRLRFSLPLKEFVKAEQLLDWPDDNGRMIYVVSEEDGFVSGFRVAPDESDVTVELKSGTLRVQFIDRRMSHGQEDGIDSSKHFVNVTAVNADGYEGFVQHGYGYELGESSSRVGTRRVIVGDSGSSDIPTCSEALQAKDGNQVGFCESGITMPNEGLTLRSPEGLNLVLRF